MIRVIWLNLLSFRGSVEYLVNTLVDVPDIAAGNRHLRHCQVVDPDWIEIDIINAQKKKNLYFSFSFFHLHIFFKSYRNTISKLFNCLTKEGALFKLKMGKVFRFKFFFLWDVHSSGGFSFRNTIYWNGFIAWWFAQWALVINAFVADTGFNFRRNVCNFLSRRRRIVFISKGLLKKLPFSRNRKSISFLLAFSETCSRPVPSWSREKYVIKS